jgi:hypothetical protein
MKRAGAWWGAALLSALACGDDGASGEDGGVGPDLFACERSSECMVVPESCCGRCGAPVRGDAIAIRRDLAADHSQRACGDDTGCPACAPLFIDPTLVATCSELRCELVDLTEHAATACEQDDDCKLRTPDCCECNGDTGVGRVIGIAVSAERAYAELVCDPSQACPECAPLYPPEVSVECSAQGRCVTDDARLP